MKTFFYFYLLTVFFIINTATATTYTSSKNGAWNVSSTWNNAGVPGSTDSVVINHTVTLAAATTISSVTISASKTLDATNNNYALTVNGAWSNSGTFNQRSATVTFSGSSAQTISGSTTTTFYDLTINTSSGITLSKAVNVSHTLTLTRGTVITTSTNLLTFNSGSSVSGASDTSYVSGPVKKIGNAAFTFPVGGAALGISNYHPLSITAPSNSSDAYTAQYYASSSGHGTNAENTIENVSSCEYWSLDRNAGSSNVSVILGWNSNSCNVFQLANMKIAYWDSGSSIWRDKGNGATTGNTAVGTVKTSAAVSSFGHFTLADSVCTTLSKSLSATHVSCNGGSNGTATVTATLGTSPYNYLWNTTSTTSSISGHSAATYSVTITDANSCKTMGNVSVTQPDVLFTTISSTNMSCVGVSNGTASVTAFGGTTSYSYLWSNSATSQTITGLTSGTYSITVTDAHGCTSFNSTAVNANIPVATIQPGNLTAACAGPYSVTLTASVGSTYLWSTVATTQAITVTSTGGYSVTVIDSNGCSATSPITYTR